MTLCSVADRPLMTRVLMTRVGHQPVERAVTGLPFSIFVPFLRVTSRQRPDVSLPVRVTACACTRVFE